MGFSDQEFDKEDSGRACLDCMNPVFAGLTSVGADKSTSPETPLITGHKKTPVNQWA